MKLIKLDVIGKGPVLINPDQICSIEQGGGYVALYRDHGSRPYCVNGTLDEIYKEIGLQEGWFDDE